MALLAVGTLVCGAGDISSNNDADRLDSEGTTATAQVVGVRTRTSRTGGDEITVAYRTAAGDRVVVVCDSCDRRKVGETVQIRYDAANPDTHVEQVGRASHRRVAVVLWIGTAVLALLLLRILLAPLLRRHRRSPRAAEG